MSCLYLSIVLRNGGGGGGGGGGVCPSPISLGLKYGGNSIFECREIMCVEWKKIFRSNLLPSFDQTLANNSD